jgi:hypothetical protein
MPSVSRLLELLSFCHSPALSMKYPELQANDPKVVIKVRYLLHSG